MAKEKKSIKLGKSIAHLEAQLRKCIDVGESPKVRRALSKVKKQLNRDKSPSPDLIHLLLDILEHFEHENVKKLEFQELFNKTTDEKTDSPESAKVKSAFSKVRRKLSEDELSSPAVIRLLLVELERLEHQETGLLEYQELFHKADKKNAILEERIRKSPASDIIFGLTLTVGAMIIGLTQPISGTKPNEPILLVLGVVLIGAGVISKLFTR